MHYTRLFDPRTIEPGPAQGPGVGDHAEGVPYVYDDEIVLAVNVALATTRPLLVSGPPGSGKSSLAENLAHVMGFRFQREAITPRTRARDLLWRYDAVRRLGDAQAGGARPDSEYVTRGVLWEAFDATRSEERTVVLLDEIDKADPDVPNSLLVALGSMRFVVEETRQEVSADVRFPPVVVLTTNDEREIPKPFLRRCITLTLEPAGRDRLVEIARAHGLAGDDGLAEEVARLVLELDADQDVAEHAHPSAAEYLDALRACRQLGIAPGTPEWEAIVRATLVKRIDPGGGAL